MRSFISYRQIQKSIRHLLRILIVLSTLQVIRKMRAPANPKRVSRLVRRFKIIMRQKINKSFAAQIISRGEQLASSNIVDCKKIDVFISSGGFRTQYALGIWSVLRHQRGKVRVVRQAGSSGGAQSVTIMSADLIENWITFVSAQRKMIKETIIFPNAPGWCQILQLFLLGGIKDMTRAALIAVYAPLAEKASTINRIHYSCSEFTKSGLRNYMVSKFESFEERFSKS